MAYALFILVNATLFIRPAEIVPSLEGLPIYNVLISACLVISFPKIISQWTSQSLDENPLHVCVLGIFTTIMLSHLVHMNFLMARSGGLEFFKIVLYYFLLIAVIDTPARLLRFLWFLVGFTIVLTVLALLHYHSVLSIPALEAVYDQGLDASGNKIGILRLCSTGIYNDPNDLCLILVVAMGICSFGVGHPRFGMLRPLWIPPLLLFGYALTKTYSRGGFMAMLMAMMVLFQARFGLRKALMLGAVALPLVLVVFGGRQTKISTEESTGQDRIQLWAQGIRLLGQEPLFGIGQHRFVEEVGLVAHNSYVHAFTELGFIGGALFLGMFYYALAALHCLGAYQDVIRDPDLKLLRPYLMAIIAAYGTGLLTISRNYIAPTYMIFAIVTVYLQLATKDSPVAPRRLGNNLIHHFVAAGILFIMIIYLFTRLFARFGA